MPKQGKRFRADSENVADLAASKEGIPLSDAITKIKSFKATKFDQTVELCMHLGIDARQADQALRGSIALPHGVGKTKRVIAFCSDDKIGECTEAGATEAGGAELVDKVAKGWFDFDVAVAEPAMMKVVSKLGRTLGPKGLMPSPKSGTVTPNISQAVKEYGAGKVEYRNDAGGNIHIPIGKLSFEHKQLLDNADTFIKHIVKIKPPTSKGHYVKRISVSATMTPGVRVME